MEALALHTIPATSARIPDFLLFDVGSPQLSMGPVHGDYAKLDRDFSALLKARRGQPITSAAGMLDQLTGVLLISECAENATGWAGHIERTRPLTYPSGVKDMDYRVMIELARPAFADFLQLLQAGLPLVGLVLDFQNIDCPIDDGPLDRPLPWDDVADHLVALTSFRLNWGQHPG